jgi:L-alanine-DL-glutamate epimerase-like enolase superfamily enzyme
MATFDERAERERGHVKITAIKAMQINDQSGQTLVKVETDAGITGYGEAGSTGPMTRAHLQWMEPLLIGQDPLNVEKLYVRMTTLQHTYRAHAASVSGIDMALWDLAGKILNVSISELLTGRLRDKVELYYTGGPEYMLDKGCCRAWFQEVGLADPGGYRTFKLGFDEALMRKHGNDRVECARPSMMLKPSEILTAGKAFENVREVLGDDGDIIVHSHNEWDVPSAIGLSEVLYPIRPLWMEDVMSVWYSEGWKALKAASKVRLATGEKLETPREFLPFLQNGALDAIHPDLAFCGGITGGRKIAELAELYYVPVVTHNVGSAIQNAASAHFGAMTRNFVMSETRLYCRPMLYQMVEEEIVVKDSKLHVPTGPGLGVTLVPDVLRANLMPGEPWWD